MSRRVGALGFDLGWASPTGWSLVSWELGGGDELLGSGEICPPKSCGKVTLETNVARAVSLFDGLVEVIEGSEVLIGACDSFVVCYEDMKWLLSAAKREEDYKNDEEKKPVTVDSLMASVYPVAILLLALRNVVGRVSIEAVGTRSARSQFGVSQLIQGYSDAVMKVAKMPEYGNVKKAKVGVSVAVRTGWGVPVSSHVADALLLSLVALDGIKMLEVPKP